MIRLSVAVSALSALLFTAVHAEEGPQVRDAVVAVVNKEVITRKDIVDRATPMLNTLDPAMPPAQREKLATDIFSNTLHTLVDEKLMVAEGERLITTNEVFKKRVEDHVNSRIETDRRKAGGEIAFRDSIAQQGRTFPQYVADVRREILRDVVLHQFVLRDLSASPREILEYYQENRAQFEEAGQVKYRQVFIRASRYESRAKARETAQYVVDLAKKDHDFSQLAEKYSDDPKAKEGGLWDFQLRGARPKPIDDLLFSLNAGEIGGPVETDIGFTVVKVEERKAGRVKPFEEVQAGIESRLISRKRVERYAGFIKRLQDENYVEILP